MLEYLITPNYFWGSPDIGQQMSRDQRYLYMHVNSVCTYVVHRAQTSDESSGQRSSSEGTIAAEYDEITLLNNAAKASTQPANANNTHFNSAYT